MFFIMMHYSAFVFLGPTIVAVLSPMAVLPNTTLGHSG